MTTTYPVAHIGAQVADGPEEGEVTVLAQGCSTVTVNGIAMATVGSPIVPHKKRGSSRPHGGAVKIGSPNVFAEGKPVARVTSAMGSGCDAEVITGSPNVNVN